MLLYVGGFQAWNWGHPGQGAGESGQPGTGGRVLRSTAGGAKHCLSVAEGLLVWPTPPLGVAVAAAAAIVMLLLMRPGELALFLLLRCGAGAWVLDGRHGPARSGKGSSVSRLVLLPEFCNLLPSNTGILDDGKRSKAARSDIESRREYVRQ